MSEENTLVVIQPDEAFDVFTKPGATDPIIAQLRAFAAEAPKDVSTLKGRKAITAFATKFVKSKTFLESFGKEIADDVKEIPKKVDAARKLLRDTCDELREAELERQAFEARRLQERAEQEARDTAARIEREAAEAKAREEADAKAREADKKHRTNVNNQVRADLLLNVHGLTHDHAKAVIEAIVRGKISHVTLAY